MQETSGPTVVPISDWNPSSLRFFERYDGPLLNDTVTLGNHALRRILEKNFEYMSRNLYFISAFGRFLLGHQREDDVIKAETIAQTTINNAIKAVQKLIGQAETLIKNAGISDSVEYGKPKVMEVKFTTPGSKAYAKLLMLADQYYSMNSLLWMEGEITSQIKFSNESAVRRIVKNVITGVGAQFVFILNKTRQRDTAEADKAGSHDENALVEAATAVIDEETNSAMVSSVQHSAPEASPVAVTDEPAITEKSGKAKAKSASKEAEAA